MRDTGRYLLTLSRPRFWPYLAGPVVVGVAHGARSSGALFSVPALALFAYFLVPANVFLYGVNDAFDADIDTYNPKKERREARFRARPATVAAVAVAGVAGLGVFATVDRAAWPALAGFFVLATAYSAPPFRFKARPFLDSLSNGLYVLPGVAAYTTLAGGSPPAAAVAGGWLWTMGMHTFSAIPDIAPDRAAGVETTATRLGRRGAYAYCVAVWAAGAAVFGVLDLRATALLAVYPVLAAAIAASPVEVDRAYWWFPAVNTGVGALLTLAGLWGLVRG